MLVCSLNGLFQKKSTPPTDGVLKILAGGSGEGLRALEIWAGPREGGGGGWT